MGFTPGALLVVVEDYRFTRLGFLIATAAIILDGVVPISVLELIKHLYVRLMPFPALQLDEPIGVGPNDRLDR